MQICPCQVSWALQRGRREGEAVGRRMHYLMGGDGDIGPRGATDMGMWADGKPQQECFSSVGVLK